jgi:hypothetical protein
MCDTLASHLYHNPNKITDEYILQLVDNGTKKCDLIVFIIDFISKFSLTNNLWLLSKIKEYCNLIENVKRNDVQLLSKYYFELLNLFKHIPKQKYIFRSEIDKKHITDADIEHVIHNINNTTTDEELASLSNVVHKDIYDKLSIFFSCITKTNSVSNQENVRICFMLVRYFLTLQPKQYLQAKHSKLDIIDIMFLVIVLFSESSHCSDSIKQYIQVSKDMFYYKVNKRKKIERINILFYIIYAVIFDDVINIAVEIEQYTIAYEVASNTSDDSQSKQVKTVKPMDSTVERCKYLFFHSDYDEPLALQIKFEKERNKLQRTYKPTLRSIDISWNINNEKDYITVLKQGKDVECSSKYTKI